MATQTLYFHKSGRIALTGRNGQRIEFERLADARNIIAVTYDPDKESPESLLAQDLSAYVERKMGGVSIISKEQYEDLKKKFPYNPADRYSARNTPRLFNPSDVVPRKSDSAQRASTAGARGDAGRAAGGSPAQPAAAPAAQGSAPVSKGRKLRTNRSTAEPAQPTQPQPPQPAAAQQDVQPADGGESAPAEVAGQADLLAGGR